MLLVDGGGCMTWMRGGGGGGGASWIRSTRVQCSLNWNTMGMHWEVMSAQLCNTQFNSIQFSSIQKLHIEARVDIYTLN